MADSPIGLLTENTIAATLKATAYDSLLAFSCVERGFRAPGDCADTRSSTSDIAVAEYGASGCANHCSACGAHHNGPTAVHLIGVAPAFGKIALLLSLIDPATVDDGIFLQGLATRDQYKDYGQ